MFQSHLFDGIVDGPKSRLPGVMEHPSVAMENEHARLFGSITIATIDTVVGPEVPVAREDIQVLCTTKKRTTEKKRKKKLNSSNMVIQLQLLIEIKQGRSNNNALV